MDGPLASTIWAANSALIVDGNLEAVGELFAPDYVAHPTEGEMEGGHDAIRRYLGVLQHAFPDLQIELEVLVEGNDRVAWQE